MGPFNIDLGLLNQQKKILESFRGQTQTRAHCDQTDALKVGTGRKKKLLSTPFRFVPLIAQARQTDTNLLLSSCCVVYIEECFFRAYSISNKFCSKKQC